MENENSLTLTKKDYFLVSFIGISFALFSIPILKNINLPFFKLSAATVVGFLVIFPIFACIALWIASLIARKLPVILQLAKFSAVGAFNTFLDWGIVNLLMALTGIFTGIWYSIFNGISFIIANLGSFFWNKHWTFSGETNDTVKKDMVQFFIVSIIGMGIKVGMASLIVNFIGSPESISPERWANVGLVSGTLFALVWNFVGYKFWVFKK